MHGGGDRHRARAKRSSRSAGYHHVYMREPLHGTPYTTREVRAHLTLMQLRDMGAMQGLLFVTGCMN